MPSPSRICRLAIVAYNPVPYQSPFYRAVHKLDGIEETVLYLDDTVMKGLFVPEFQATISFGPALLEGFRYKVLRNWSPRSTTPFVGRFNPGIFWEIGTGGYDAVLVTGYTIASSLFAILAAKLFAKKLIFRTEGDLSKKPGRAKEILKRAVLRTILGWSHAVLYSCRKNRDYFLHYGARESALFPTLSSIDNEAVGSAVASYKAKRAEIRQEMDIPQDATVFVFVGRMTERKCVLDLWAAYRELCETEPAAALIMIGSGPELKLLRDRLASSEDRSVHLLGFVPEQEVPKYLAVADAFVLPSAYDPTPKALNEALAAGLPAIVSDGVGTADDLVQDGVNGFVVPVGDIAGFRDSMRRMMTPALRQEMATAARRSVAGWSPEQNAAGLRDAVRHAFTSNA